MKSLRTAISSLISHSAGNVAYRIASLLLISIYAANLGPSELGKLEQLFALSLLLIPIISFQIPDAVISAFGKPAFSATAGPTAIAGLLTGILIFILSILLLTSCSLVGRLTAIALAAHVTSSIGWQFVRNALRSAKDFAYLVTCETTQSLILICSGLLLLRMNGRYQGALLSIAISNIIAIALAFALSRSLRKLLTSHSPSLDTWKFISSITKRLLPNVALWWAIEMSDRWIIANYLGDEQVGLYGAAARISGIGMMVCLLIYQSWQVFAINALHDTRNRDRFFEQTITPFAIGTSLIFSTLMALAAPISKTLFGSEFIDSYRISAILTPALFLSIYSYFFGVAFYSNQYASSAWKGGIAGLACSLLINFSLLPMLGTLAAALASLVAYTAILAIRYREAKGIINAKLNGRNFFIPLLILLLQGVGILTGVPSGILFIGPLLLVAFYWKSIAMIANQLLAMLQRQPN